MTILIHDKYSSETGWQGYLWYTRKLFCHGNGSNTARIVLFGIENVLQKKRKPDVVRKDVQWSTKKPHMLKKMEHKVKQTKQACPGLRIDWTRIVNQKFPCIRKVVRQQLKFHVRNVCFPSVLLLFVYLLVCFVYSIYDKSLLTTLQPTARKRERERRKKSILFFFFQLEDKLRRTCTPRSTLVKHY